MSYTVVNAEESRMNDDGNVCDLQLAKACREALERAYGFTIPVPKAVSKKTVH